MKFRAHLTGALIGGALVRLLVVVGCREDVPSGDATVYVDLAENLAGHGVYALGDPPLEPSVVRAPLASAAFAACFLAFGRSAWPVHALLSAVGLMGALLLVLGVRRRAPQLAAPVAWAVCCFPLGAIYASRFLSETFVAAAIAGAAGALLLARPTRAAAACGLLLGLAALAKDVYLPLVVLLPALTVLLERRRLGFEVRHAVLAVLVATAVIAPWTARNVLIGKPTVVSKGLMGENLFIGTWEVDGRWASAGSHHDFPPEAFESPAEEERVRALVADPVGNDAALRDIAVARIRARPLQVVGVWLRRMPHLWIGSRTEAFSFRPAALERGRAGWWALKIIAWSANLAVLAGGLLGAALTIRRREVLRLLVVPVGWTAAVYLPFHSTENRYSEPVLALIVVLCVHGCVEVWRARRRPRGLDPR